MVELLASWLHHESDPRVDHWFLMSSPFPTVFICFSFLVLAKLLHVYMKPRDAVNIVPLIWGFDFFHLTISASLIFVAFKLQLLQNFNFR